MLLYRPRLWKQDHPPEIDAAQRLRRNWERAWRRSRSPVDFQILKTQKNNRSYIINKGKQADCNSFISERAKAKLNWLDLLLKSILLTPKEDLCFLNHSHKDMLFNDIGEFFVQKITRIRRQIDATILSEDIRALRLGSSAIEWAGVVSQKSPLVNGHFENLNNLVNLPRRFKT